MKLLARLLLSEGVLDEAGLGRAIERHVVGGQDFSDALLDLQLTDEATLERLLAKRYGTPSPAAEGLEPTAAAVSDLPELLIWRYRVFPLSSSGRQLKLAMVNPVDRAAVMAISSKTGRIVKPYVIAPATWRRLVARHLGKPRRYEDDAPRRPRRLDLPDIQQALLWINGQLGQAQAREEVAGPLLDFLASVFKRVIVFLASGGRLLGWDGLLDSGGDDERELIGAMSIPLSVQGVLATVWRTGAPYLGPLDEERGTRLLREYLGDARQPKTAFVAPLAIGGRVVQVFYLDRGPGQRVPSELADVALALAQAGREYERLIRRQVSQTLGGE